MTGSIPAITFLSLAVISLGVAYYPTLAEVASICWNNDDYSHGIILPAITAYIFWDRKDQLKKILDNTKDDFHKLAGTSALVAGLILFVLGTAGDLLFIKWFSLFPTITGLMLLSVGSPLSTALLPPLLLNFMALPIPGALVPKLFGPFQAFAAKCSAWSLEALGVPVYVVGNVINVPHMQLLVEEACSGMRSLMAMVTVALIVLMIVEMSKLAKVSLLAISIVVAIILNIFRVVGTGLLAHFVDPAMAEGFIHDFSGFVVFGVGLAIMYSIGKWVLSK